MGERAEQRSADRARSEASTTFPARRSLGEDRGKHTTLPGKSGLLQDAGREGPVLSLEPGDRGRRKRKKKEKDDERRKRERGRRSGKSEQDL